MHRRVSWRLDLLTHLPNAQTFNRSAASRLILAPCAAAATCGQWRTISASRPLNESRKIEVIRDGVRKLKLFSEIDVLPAELDWSYILDEKNLEKIESNNQNRKGVGDIRLVHKLSKEIDGVLEKSGKSSDELGKLIETIYHKAAELSNQTHPDVPIGDYDQVKCILKTGKKIEKKTPTIDEIAKLYGWLKEEQLSLFSTQRAYILKKELADMELALVNYTLDYLNKKGFIPVSVPDILHHSIIESCGFPTKGVRSQVYKLDYGDEYGQYCLSGTSEMSLAGLLKNRVFNDAELPLKFCAVSRCFRAEVSGSEREGKLYRLHEFTKVEMFVLTQGEHAISNQMLEEIKQYQIELFSNLGLHFQVLDMSTQELGAPAYRKYDIESFCPANQFYGEISSTSNCTDYQSRRLHIKSSKNKLDDSEPKRFVHTLNGTACAIPRMLTCIVESNWDMQNKLVHVPEKLQPYMGNRQVLKVPKDFRKAQALRFLK